MKFCFKVVCIERLVFRCSRGLHWGEELAIERSGGGHCHGDGFNPGNRSGGRLKSRWFDQLRDSDEPLYPGATSPGSA